MIIFRYISKELYSSLTGMVLILLIIFMSNQFIHYLHYAAEGSITMAAVMKLMILQVPFLLGYLIPLSLYISILLVFGRLYLDNEMTVMAACGVSPLYLLGVVLSVSGVIFLIVSGLMLWLQPIIDNLRIRIFYQSIAQATIDKVAPKRFQVLGANGVFYADNISRANQELQNIFFALKQKPNSKGVENWDITLANAAQQKKFSGENFMLFKQGYKYHGAPGQPDFQIIQFKEYGIRISSQVSKRNGWPSNASTKSLWPDRHKAKVAAELHWRIAMPISTIILTFLAFPLSRVNPRRGKFTQLLPAILLYIIYGNLLFLGKAWLTKHFVSFNLGLWWVHGFMALVILSIFTYRFFKNANT